MARFNLRNATITLRDRGIAFLEIKIGDGTFTYTEKRTINFVKDRGVLSTVREGEQQQMDVAFQFVWDEITASSGGDPPTIEDVLKHRSVASGWVSASTDPDAPFCVDLELVFIPSCHSTNTEVLVFPQFHYEDLSHSAKDGTIDCKGRCNATQALASRIAQA